jgi:hypothetical protein
VFIRIPTDKDCPLTLEEPEDFARFHVEVVGLEASELRTQVKRRGVGRIIDEDHVAVAITTIKSLAGQRSPSWERSFDAMIDYARSKGWLSDEYHIQAHCIRHPGATDSTQAPQ